VATNLLLLRSAETRWGADGRLVGARNLGLSATGKAQAERARDALDGVDVADVVSSPLERAQQTAEIIAERIGQSPTIDKRMAAVDIGPLEGLAPDELANARAYRELIAGNPSSFFGRESLARVRQRALSSVIQAIEDNDEDASLLFVTHSVPLRALLAHYLGIPITTTFQFFLAHGSFTVLAVSREAPTKLLCLNHVGQLCRIFDHTKGALG
jgi:broad specificity phosphatase PhoE